MLIGAAILAAGASRRFGSDKRLHLIDGQPMLALTLAAYRAVFGEVAVVIRPDEPDVANLVATAGAQAVEAERAHEGQSRSLAAAVYAMRHCDGLVVGLGDMPFVQRSTLAALRDLMIRKPQYVARPICDERPGNPVGFPRRLFATLTELDGDVGARSVIAAEQRLALLPVDDDGIHRDIDRPN